jgi:hypothetical protein
MGIKPASPLLPAAISTFRKNRSYPARRTGVPAKNWRNQHHQVSANQQVAANQFRPWQASFCSLARLANLFQGQIAKQSSQPKMRLPMA